jgi:glycosyltransferase involved in cell wall biosynthesis
VVIVDDGSDDATASVARDAGAVVLRHLVNRGQGAALQTAIRYALNGGAHYLVTFDADGQHSADEIALLLAPIERGEAEFVLGSRFLGSAVNMSRRKRLLLRAAVLFTRRVSRVHLTDTHNGLRAFSRLAASRVRITEDRMAHASELIDQIVASGLPYREVPVTIHYTDYSRAKGQRPTAALRVLFDYLVRRILGPV